MNPRASDRRSLCLLTYAECRQQLRGNRLQKCHGPNFDSDRAQLGLTRLEKIGMFTSPPSRTAIRQPPIDWSPRSTDRWQI